MTAEAHRSAFLLEHTDPEYPLDAKAPGIEGNVILDIVIDKNGSTQTVAVRSGQPVLADAALKSIREWRYRPTKLNGKPVEVQTEVEVSFGLPGSVSIR